MITDGWDIKLRERLAPVYDVTRLRVLVQGKSLLNGLDFDPLTLFEDSLASPDVDVLRCKIVQVLMIPSCVVVMDEPALAPELTK